MSRRGDTTHTHRPRWILAATVSVVLAGGSGRAAATSEPGDITVEPGDDVAAMVAGVASGSTLTFAPGSYEVASTIVVETSLEIVGAGIGETTITSTTPGIALAFLGPGELAVRDLSVHHVGEEAASVLLAIEGDLELLRVEVAGGVGVDGEAGHGIIFAFEDLADLPERTDEERAGPLVVEDSLVTGNDGVGILVTGSAEPEIIGTEIADNVTCGVCYIGPAGGTLAESTVRGEGDLGVQAIGTSTPRLEGNTISGFGVGVLAAESSDVAVIGNVIDDNEIGTRVLDESAAVVADNTIRSSEVAGVSVSGAATATIDGNRITAAAVVGVEVADEATATISGNAIDGEGDVGVSFLGTASGAALFNDIQRRGIGVQVGGAAAPDIVGNRVVGSRFVGLLFADEAAGSVRLNQVDQLVGSAVEVAGSSHPDLVGNEVDGSRFGIVYSDDAAGSADGNRFRRHDVGVQVQGAAGPSLTGNRFDGIAMAAMVFTGTFAGVASGNDCGAGDAGIIAVVATATPTLTDNLCEVVAADAPPAADVPPGTAAG